MKTMLRQVSARSLNPGEWLFEESKVSKEVVNTLEVNQCDGC